MNKLAGHIYLSFCIATDYPEQYPEHKFAKWYDLLWLLIPICGIIPFSLAIKVRYEMKKP